MEGLDGFGGFAGWQTVPLKAHRKLCCGLGPGVPVGEVALALGCLLGRFGAFGVFAGWQTVPLKAHRKLCCGLFPGVLVGEVALALGCLLGKVFGGFGGFWRVWEFWRVFGGFGRFWRVWRVWRVLEGVWRVLEGLEGFGAFGVFAGWQTAALKANRKPLLWPWPWGACLRSGLGPGVPVGEGVWRVWRVLEGLEGFGGCLEGLDGFGGFAGWQTAPLKAHRKLCCGLTLGLGCLLGKWPWPWGACWGWRVWKVLEGLERLRAGKRQL